MRPAGLKRNHEQGATMYIHEQLIKTRHDARLRAAARRRLIADAQRSRRTALWPLEHAAGYVQRLLPRVSPRPAGSS
jgi:hypothetical protein